MASALPEISSRVAQLLRQLDEEDARKQKQAHAELDQLCYPRVTRPAKHPDGRYMVPDDIAEMERRLAAESGIVQPLWAALGNGGAVARSYACTRLGFLRLPETLDSILACTKNDEPAVRRSAVSALRYFSDSRERVIDVLLEAMRDPDEQTAHNAASSLSHLRANAAVAPLLAWTTDRNWHRRSVAYSNLAYLQDPAIIEVAHRGLTDPKPQVRQSAKGVLAGVDWRRRNPESI